MHRQYKMFQDRFELQSECVNHCFIWISYCSNPGYSAVWYANGCWRIGYTKNHGTDNCVIKASSSSDDLPDNSNLKWLYWNPDVKTWTETGNVFQIE